ncbi:MAG: DUF6944 family repetitive protein [Lysinibacillus sp.]
MNEAQISAWLIAVGTVLSAIGSTPSDVLSESALEDLDLIGSVLQAVGSGIIPADADYLEKAGGQIETVGDLLTVQSFFVEDERASELLNAQGNLIQAVGTGLALNLEANQTVNEALFTIGEILQIIGNAYIAYSINYPPNSEKSQEFITVGSWIEAIGAVLSALTVDS